MWNVKYILEKDEKKLSSLMHLMDTKMNIFELRNKLYFSPGSSCPLAPQFGGRSVELSKPRNKKQIENSCRNVKKSCCALGVMKDFLIDSKIAALRLSSYYKNDFKLNMFLLSGLTENLKLGAEDPYNAECQGEINSNRCAALMLNIERAVIRAKMYVEKYKEDFTNCTNRIEQTRLRLRCASCDPENNRWFNLQSKKIVINKAYLNSTVTLCFNYSLYTYRIERAVYQAYLNYARQVIPSMAVDDQILWKMFPDDVHKCSEWIQYTEANSDSDFTRSAPCLKYGFKVLEKSLGKPSDLRFSEEFTTYFEEVIGGIITPEAGEQMNALLPTTVRPMKQVRWESRGELRWIDNVHKMMLDWRKAQKAKKNSKQNKGRVLMSEIEKKRLENAEKDMENGEDTDINKIRTPTEWGFLVAQDPRKGIMIGEYRDHGAPAVDIKSFLDGQDSMDLGKLLSNLRAEKEAEKSARHPKAKNAE